MGLLCEPLEGGPPHVPRKLKCTNEGKMQGTEVEVGSSVTCQKLWEGFDIEHARLRS
jgi:hypothetical protein